ncbi:MAG: TIR domain-containing protein [Pirellulaceae bacterium]|nr:TIR domain-containing protein [Pirellulaceae bacterium]
MSVSIPKLDRPITPRVLISYSHDSPEHAARAAELANRLRRDGIDCWIDQFDPHPSQGWPMWMEEQIGRAKFVLLVCTERYFKRFNGEEVPGVGRGVIWESILIRNELYQSGHQNDKFIPVCLEPGFDAFVPSRLRGDTRYMLDSFVLEKDRDYTKLHRRLTGQAAMVPEEVGPVVQLASLEPGAILADLQSIVDSSRLLLNSLASTDQERQPRYESAYALRYLGFDVIRPTIRDFVARNEHWFFHGIPSSLKQRVLDDFQVQHSALRGAFRVPFAVLVSSGGGQSGCLRPEGDHPLIAVDGTKGLKAFLEDPLLYSRDSRLARYAVLRHVLFDEAVDLSKRHGREITELVGDFAAGKDIPCTGVFWGLERPPLASAAAIIGSNSVVELLKNAGFAGIEIY